MSPPDSTIIVPVSAYHSGSYTERDSRFIKIDKKVHHGIGFAPLPCVLELFGPLPDVGRACASIDPARIGQEGFFPLPLGLARRLCLVATGLHLQLAKHQMVSQLFDLMKDAALVSNAIEMIIQGTLQPVGAVADHLVGGRHCDALALEFAKERLPGVGPFALRHLPMHDFPMPIGPHAKCAQDHPLLLALDGAT